jgi:hypothetical protein
MPAEQRSRDRQAVISAGRARLQKTFSGEFPNYAAGGALIIFDAAMQQSSD